LAIARWKIGKAVQVALSPGQREIEGEPASARRRAHSRIHVFTEVLAQPSWNEFILLPREVNQIAVVASEQLVAPISRECHRHMLPSCARNVVCRYHGGVTKRLFQHCRQLVESFFDLRLNDELVMLGAKLLRHSTRVLRFVEVLFRKTNRKGLDGAVTG